MVALHGLPCVADIEFVVIEAPLELPLLDVCTVIESDINIIANLASHEDVQLVLEHEGQVLPDDVTTDFVHARILSGLLMACCDEEDMVDAT